MILSDISVDDGHVYLMVDGHNKILDNKSYDKYKRFNVVKIHVSWCSVYIFLKEN